MPKVSVIIPAYNVEKYIKEAIQSVLAQTFRDLEVIVINDGSTDDTLNIVESLAKYDHKLSIISQPNSGKPSVARNVGLAKATGEFVCFLDGDDVYHPAKIERGVEILEKFSEKDVVFHDMELIDENGKSLPGTYLGNVKFLKDIEPYITKKDNNVLLLGNRFYNFMCLNYAAFHTITVMIRKTRFKKKELLFSEDMIVCEDTDLWLRLAFNKEAVFVNEVLSSYRQYANSISKDKERMLKGTIEMLRKNYVRANNFLSNNELICYRKRIAKEFQYLGYYYFNRFEMKDARSAYIKAIMWFFNINSFLGIVKTFIPQFVIKEYRLITTSDKLRY